MLEEFEELMEKIWFPSIPQEPQEDTETEDPTQSEKSYNTPWGGTCI